MPVTLTIKQVPDDLADALRSLAAKNHRSLQGELMAIIESVASQQNSARAGNAFQQTPVFRAEEDPGRISAYAEDAVTADGLLDDLDAIVAGSQWGDAPILTRAQSNDRALARELDYQVQEEAGKYKR
ncbi:MAG: hypothetical protein HGA47_11610 [Zoogloea sp.]|nr:hypothetical protein [Zoogloea sp.]